VLGLLLAVAAGAATLTVDDSGGANYTRIQDAINNSNNGDTILVYSGTYFENVNMTKQLTLRGIGMPVVDARGNGNAITLVADGITLEGFTATGSGFSQFSQMAGIMVTSSNNTLIGNNASNNSNADGISLQYSNNNTLISNNVSNNGIGIHLSSSGNSTLSNNNASHNAYGIYLEYSSNNNLDGNYANSNSLFGIFMVNSSNNNLDGNYALDNYSGIDLVDSSNNTLFGNNANSKNYEYADGIILSSSSSNTLINNNALNNGRYGIYVYYSNNNNLSGNNASNNNYGIYLDSSNNNHVYNNYFSNTNNAYDNGNNLWNIPKTSGTNIIEGSFLGGNFWSDYAGIDIDGDGLGDKMLPYTSSGGIVNGGDYLPLTIAPPPTAGGSISGYKINDTNGNGKWNKGEKGISNWTIRLIGITGKGKNAKVIRKEILTDATGFYKFDNLLAGRYFVIEKLKKGFVATSSPVKRIRLSQGKNSINNNFTNRPVNSWDNKDDNRDIDDYKAINRDIDKYKEDINWD
jgi:parallel beta-helix repeat protein